MTKPYSPFHATAADYVLGALKYGSCKAATLAYDMDITGDALNKHIRTLQNRGYVIYTVGKFPHYVYELQDAFSDGSPITPEQEADRAKRRGEGLA